MSAPVRVLIVDDDALVRSGLRMMLAGTDRVEVVGEAQDGSEVLAAVDAHRPDVLPMDLRLPTRAGLPGEKPPAPATATPRRPGPDDVRRRRGGARRAAGRRRGLPPQGHPTGRDRAGDRAGRRGRGDAAAAR